MQRIASLYAVGKSATSIAKEIGRSKGAVIHAVRHNDTVKVLIDEQREELADLFDQVTRQALLHITGEKLEKSSARDLGVLAGIALDKTRLLSGQSTTNLSVLLAGPATAAEVHASAAYERIIEVEVLE
jgi:hypothetical protein